MKILAGVHQPDAGTIEIGGEEVSFGHPVQAQQAGLSTVFQEFNLLPERSIAENIYLGREPRRRGLSTPARCTATPRQLLDGLGVTRPAARRSGSARCRWPSSRSSRSPRRSATTPGSSPWTSRPPRSPTTRSSCSTRSSATSPSRGIAIIYVSHRLKEIFDLCDTITVLKDGRQVTTAPAAELDDADVVRLMVGRSISSFFPDPVPGTEVGEPRLELRGAGNGYVDGIDLTLRAGEIVGVVRAAGLGPHRAARGDLRHPPVHPRRDAARRQAGPVPLAAQAPSAAGWRWSPRTARPPAWRCGRRSSTTPWAWSARSSRGVPPPPRREVPGVLSSLDVSARRDGPGGPVPLRRQPAEGRPRPLAAHPAPASC